MPVSKTGVRGNSYRGFESLPLRQYTNDTSPEHGGSYTLKKYRSSKKQNADSSWRHESIFLEPLNPAFDAIEIGPENALDVKIIAEFVAVL